MIHQFLYFPIITISLSLLFVSCENKRALAEEQALLNKIEALEQEVKEAKMSLPADPGDQREALKDVTEELELVSDELDAAEKVKSQLEDEFAKLEKQFFDYKKKYPIN